MHKPPKFAPVVVFLLIATAAIWYLTTNTASADDGTLTASGTIEARQVNVSAEIGGRIQQVSAGEGQLVEAGELVILLDGSLIEVQVRQAQAALQAAEAGVTAAQKNLDLIKAGPSAEQLAVAQAAINQGLVAADAARDAYDELTEAMQDSAKGKELKLKLDQAEAALATARANYNLVKAGARPQQIEASEAQLAAVIAQRDAAREAMHAVEVQLARTQVLAPISGVVLEQPVEAGEFASPGATLLVIGQLDHLTLTVYVPEDRYGQIQVGQECEVTVDSFPGQIFQARVTQVAGKAEFTPRNVQTTESRKTTVFAVKLAVENTDGSLKPGMPADVRFK